MYVAVALFTLAFAPTVSAIAVPVDPTAGSPAPALETVVAAIGSDIDHIVASIEAVVGNLAAAVTDQADIASNVPRLNTASAAEAVAPIENTSEALTAPNLAVPSSPPTPATTNIAPSVPTAPTTAAASDNIFELESAVAALTEGVQGLAALLEEQTPSSKIESQIAALQSALASQNNAAPVYPLGDGNGIAAASNIGQLSGVTITNASINATSIPDLSGRYLSVSGGTLTGALVNSGSASSSFAGALGIGTTTPSTALSVIGAVTVTDGGSSSIAQVGTELTTDGNFTSNPSSSWTLGSDWSWDSTNSRAQYAGAGGPISSIAIDNGGTGYTNGDTITISGGSGDATYTATVSAGKVTALTAISAGTAYSASGSSVIATTGGTGTGLTVSILQIANGATLSENIAAPSSGNSRVTFTVVGYTGNGLINVSLSGSNTYFNATSTNYQASGTFTVVLSNGSAIVFTPTADFSGEITNVSVASITSPSSVLRVNNTDSSDAFDFRPGGINQDNAFIGFGAGGSNTTGSWDTGVGWGALYSNTTGGNNTAVGYRALMNDTTGPNNTAIGIDSLFLNTTGNDNTSIGVGTMYNNTTGFRNTAVGQSALGDNTTGAYNTALNFGALTSNTTGNGNTAIGYYAMDSNTIGTYNIAVGYTGLRYNTTGSYNVALGGLLNNTTGSYNTGLSTNALFANTTGSYNFAAGYYTLSDNTTGSYNLALGYQASLNLTTGSQNIALGYNVGLASSTGSQQLNIGDLLYGSGLYNGGSVSSAATAAGKIGIGTANPYSRLQITGPDAASSTSAFAVVNSASTTVLAVFDGGNAQLSGTLTQSSDQRLKTNIASLDGSSSLAEINALNPITFNWIDPNQDNRTQFGFIAQQVQGIFPSLVSTTSPTALTPNGTLGLNYIDLISPVVAAIQELDKEIKSFASTVAGFAQSFTTQQLCVSSGPNDPNPVCITKSQLAALLASANQSAGAPTSPPSPSDATEAPPVIQINGDNPAVIQVGASYTDLGATITGPQADLNLGIQTYLNGVLESPIELDTSAAATDTVAYVVTDSYGLASTSTRMVIIEAAASPQPAATSSSATTTVQ